MKMERRVALSFFFHYRIIHVVPMHQEFRFMDVRYLIYSMKLKDVMVVVILIFVLDKLQLMVLQHMDIQLMIWINLKPNMDFFNMSMVVV